METIKNLLFYFMLGSAIGAAIAAPTGDYTKLEWIAVDNTAGNTPMTTHDQAQGYKIYCSPTILDSEQLKIFTNQVDVPGGSTVKFMLADITTLQEGDNWCAMTAYNFDNSGNEQEGAISNWLNVKKTAGRFINGCSKWL